MPPASQTHVSLSPGIAGDAQVSCIRMIPQADVPEAAAKKLLDRGGACIPAALLSKLSGAFRADMRLHRRLIQGDNNGKDGPA
jgi:hypothetical protein